MTDQRSRTSVPPRRKRPATSPSGRGGYNFAVIRVFPGRDSPHFEEYNGAAVACWVGEPMSSAELTRELTGRVAHVGWRMARIFDEKSVADYPVGHSGRERFLYAQQHGFACHFFRVARETLPGYQPLRAGMLRPAYEGFCRRARTRGVYVEIGKTGDMIKRRAPGGSPCVALWESPEQASERQDARTSHTWMHLPSSELKGLLDSIDRDEGTVVAPCVDGSLVTFDALALVFDLENV